EMNVAQDQSETAYVNLHKAQKALKTQRQRVDLKVAEYEAFVTEAAQQLAAKDKKISELEAQLSAAQNKN
ncbi:uncharacterized protein METZ01_LOCUS281786, partial [marine metagenome]